MVSETQLSLVEAALNRVLGADPDSAARLARLAGRTIRIDSWIVDEVSVYLTFSEDGISISRHFEGKVDASIRGGALGFARGAMNPGDRRVFTDGTLTIEGDTGVVQAFADVFRLFRSDWPSRVSPLIGDAATARIEALVDSLEDWRRDAKSKLASDMGDYLREEKRLLASREAVREFTDAVDELVSDVSRLEQRIARIERGRR